MPHFIYCGYHYSSLGGREKLKEIMLTKMRKYGIKSSILTMLNMVRRNLVTKETVKKAAEGKLKNDENWWFYEGSINDDLESFLFNLQNKNEIKEDVLSFFTPKLTNEELRLVQEGNVEHLKTYNYHFLGLNHDIDVEEMEKSDSKSKYVHGWCRRRTIPLTLATSQIEDEMEIENGTETIHKSETVDEDRTEDKVLQLPEATKRKIITDLLREVHALLKKTDLPKT